MNINFKFLLLGTTLSLIPNITNAQCVATTDCATLGYTEKSCPDSKGLKCPFGNTYACPATDKSICEKYGFKYTCTGEGYTGGSGHPCNKQYISCMCNNNYTWKNNKCEKIKPILGQCTGYAQNCKIGDILNHDGTCTTDKENNKTPIAVVVYISNDGKCGQAITANSIAHDEWGNYGFDIPSLPNDGENVYVLEHNTDSCGNTKKIIQAGNAQTYPAAWHAFNYAPAAAPETKGKWCLPTYGILYNIAHDRNEFSANLQTIEKTIEKIGGHKLSHDTCLWTSNEIGTKDAFHYLFNANHVTVNFHKDNDFIGIRPVIEF